MMHFVLLLQIFCTAASQTESPETNESASSSLVQIGVSKSGAETTNSYPYKCEAARSNCWYICEEGYIQVCDKCNLDVCPDDEPNFKPPEQCMYQGGDNIKSGRLGCAEMVKIGDDMTVGECLTAAQTNHNPAHIGYKHAKGKRLSQCWSIPDTAVCTSKKGANGLHYYDCSHKCAFTDNNKCVYDDGTQITGHRKSVDFPEQVREIVDASTCLFACEEAARKNKKYIGGCCQWNEQRANCRYFGTTNEKTGKQTSARNQNKWAVNLEKC